VMRRRGGEDRIGLAKIAIDTLEAFQETGHRAGADGKMPPDLDITAAQFAGDDAEPLFGVRVFHEQQFLREQLTEPGRASREVRPP
jgi:hypothetical protein